MRLLGFFDSEKQAYRFYAYLLQEGIQNTYEPFVDAHTKRRSYRIWITQEDDLPAAEALLEKFQANPDDPLFQKIEVPFAAPNEEEMAETSSAQHPKNPRTFGFKVRLAPRVQSGSFGITQLIILICALTFFWDSKQKDKIKEEKGVLGEQLILTSLEKKLLFDYPNSRQVVDEVLETLPLKSYKDVKELPEQQRALIDKAEALPAWKGVYDFILHWKTMTLQQLEKAPRFEKISQGEIWRLITPCLLHHDFLHILFNMAWVWMLGKQIELRLRKTRMVLLMLIIGVISNVAQYLVSGPYFLGYSGIVVGMAGFIWVRQKLAPWEGYPLQRSTFIFLLIFVLAMTALGALAFFLEYFSLVNISASIANTAHIVGGLVGMGLGALPLFAKRSSS